MYKPYSSLYTGATGAARRAVATLLVSAGSMRAVELETHFEVVRNFVIVTYVQRDFAVFSCFDVALPIGITGTEVETVFGGSACYADIVVGSESGLEDLILPVGVARPWEGQL